MKYLFHLSGESYELALAELGALFEAQNSKFKMVSKRLPIIIVESQASEKDIKKISERSALLRHSGILITSLKTLYIKDLDKIDWSFVKQPYCVRVEDLTGLESPDIEGRLASPIWWYIVRTKKGVEPEVSLENPKTVIQFFIDDKISHITKLIWKSEKGRFKEREPMMKPAFHPTGLKPKLARLLVNLSRVREKETLLDSFCGTSSTLIEAALIGMKTVGVDMDKKMINASKANLDFYHIKDYKLIEGNALQLEKNFIPNSVDAIATDPPYGRSSRVGAPNLRALYGGFLKSAYIVLKKNRYVAMLYPHYVKIDNLVNKKHWKVVNTGSIYVHSSLTRKVLVLQKR